MELLSYQEKMRIPGLFNLQSIRFGRDPINVYVYLMLGNKKKELVSSHRYPIR